MSRASQGGSATPARNTRARNQTPAPLPGLATKQSHAYGAQGKPNLHNQLRTTSTTAFAEQFTAQQSAARQPAPSRRVTRSNAGSEQPDVGNRLDDDDSESEAGAEVANAMPAARSARARSPVKRESVRPSIVRQRQRQQHQRVEEEELEDEEEGEPEEEDVEGEVEPTPSEESDDHPRNPTGLGQGFNYQGAPAPHPVAERTPPNSWRMSWRTYRGDLTYVLVIMLLVLLYIPLSGHWETVRFNAVWNAGRKLMLPGFSGPPEEAINLWYKSMHENMTSKMFPNDNLPELQWSINNNFLNRMAKMEASMEEVKAALGLHDETLDYLGSILPEKVVVRETNGQYEIPQHFWEALRQRLISDDEHVAPLWDNFVHNNEQQLDMLTLRSAARILGEATDRAELITKDRFVQVLDKHNAALTERYHKDFKLLWQQNLQQAKESAKKTTEETLERYSTNAMVKKQLETLVKATDVQNTYEALRQYNWFTYGIGVIVDPHMTSAVEELPEKSWRSKLWGTSEPPSSYLQNPPATVLLPWTEVTQCWCAASSPDGSAQITLTTEEHFYPDSLIVEHTPALGTRTIKNAPRDIEIWVDVDSEEKVERFAEKFEQKFAYAAYSNGCTMQPSPTHICVYQGRYDIHAHNHVQTFPLWIEAKEHELAVNRFTVRFVNNWGGQRTCIYRLRLTGEEMEVGEGEVQDGQYYEDAEPI